MLTAIHGQSNDINQGVDRGSVEEQGAGDQGMMFGYATDETENFMPLALDLSHLLLRELAKIRRENDKIKYLRPDAKSQVTIEYDEQHKPIRIDSIVISTQHDEFVIDNNDPKGAEKQMQDKIYQDIVTELIPRVVSQLPDHIQKLFTEDIKYHINPTGKFVIGGPHGDTGLTGRKIIVDTYGGKGAHGGGAFSGKDPSKVDRSAAYATRWIAKNLVAAGVAKQVLVQVSYAIGVVEPTGINVNTYGTALSGLTDIKIAEIVKQVFDLRPGVIEQDLKLRNPIYSETAAYGHMGRENKVVTKQFKTVDGSVKSEEVELFTWEKLNKVEDIRKLMS